MLLRDSPCSSEVRIIRRKFSLSTLFENLFSEALLLNSRLYWPIKVVETYFRRLAVLLFPEADAHFREMSAHVNTYFKKVEKTEPTVYFSLKCDN